MFFSEFLITSSRSDVEEETFTNSIEIYNPTDGTIDLENYSLKLANRSGGTLDLFLTGLLESGAAFVVSNETNNEEIIARTNLFFSELDFTEYGSIELLKGVEISDKLGNVENDFDNLDLSTLSGLLIRRSKLVQKGTPNFVNDDLLKEWSIYPDPITNIEDLGIHGNAC